VFGFDGNLKVYLHRDPVDFRYRHRQSVDSRRAVDAPESDGHLAIHLRKPASRSDKNPWLGWQWFLAGLRDGALARYCS
jgi:hypothetical protein